MKTIATIFTILLISINAEAQNILRVNNNPAAAAPYTNLQDAINDALTDDFIILEGSATNYGDVSINKKLTITGPGNYFTGGNAPNPITQANQLAALVANMTFTTGSDGTVVEGVQINTALRNNISATYYDVNEVTIRRCWIQNFNLGGTQATVQGATMDWLITQTVINGSITLGHASNISFTNSIIRHRFSLHHETTVNAVNNTFTAEANSNIAIYNSGLNTSLAVSNSIYNNNTASVDLGIPDRGNSISFSHTLFRSTGVSITQGTDVTELSTDNGNVFNVDMNFVFLPAASNSVEGRWQLAAGSPAIGAGAGGIDCGAYGGATPYVLSQIPAVPVITKMSTTGGGTDTSPLKVTISATGNQ